MEHTNILDEEGQGLGRLYCDKSLRFLSYSLFCLMIGLLVAVITNYFNLLVSLSLTLVGIPIIAMLMTTILGVWYAIQSIRFREEKPLKQLLGLCGNLIILTLFFVMFFALIPSKSSIDMPNEIEFEIPEERMNDSLLDDSIQ